VQRGLLDRVARITDGDVPAALIHPHDLHVGGQVKRCCRPWRSYVASSTITIMITTISTGRSMLIATDCR
jgi:hypothetical protein